VIRNDALLKHPPLSDRSHSAIPVVNDDSSELFIYDTFAFIRQMIDQSETVKEKRRSYIFLQQR